MIVNEKSKLQRATYIPYIIIYIQFKSTQSNEYVIYGYIQM